MTPTLALTVPCRVTRPPGERPVFQADPLPSPARALGWVLGRTPVCAPGGPCGGGGRLTVVQGHGPVDLETVKTRLLAHLGGIGTSLPAPLGPGPPAFLAATHSSCCPARSRTPGSSPSSWRRATGSGSRRSHRSAADPPSAAGRVSPRVPGLGGQSAGSRARVSLGERGAVAGSLGARGHGCPLPLQPRAVLAEPGGLVCRTRRAR